ncbi:MAG TPA: LEA type 2 family protein [Bradyrhizobium sp.]|nr:LEA type 2 family protein [Bradyrhizobium sp.]
MRALSPRASFQVLLVLSTLVAVALGGCAGMVARDPVRVNVVGLEALPGQGLEMRFNVKLRLQNPNETPIEYDGLALELELNGKPFATGVSDQQGRVPRFGETVIVIPVTVSALSAVRQAIGLVTDATLDNVPYRLRGRLSGSPFGGTTFTETGTLSLPAIGKIDR